MEEGERHEGGVWGVRETTGDTRGGEKTQEKRKRGSWCWGGEQKLEKEVSNEGEKGREERRINEGRRNQDEEGTEGLEG